jgi:uncharacterized repeat protein (TIGR03803 family)
MGLAMNSISKWTKALSVAALAVSAVITTQSAQAQTFTTLYSFSGNTAAPYAGLVQGTSGELYGTTNEGGNNGMGTIYKITPGGTSRSGKVLVRTTALARVLPTFGPATF